MFCSTVRHRGICYILIWYNFQINCLVIAKGLKYVLNKIITVTMRYCQLSEHDMNDIRKKHTMETKTLRCSMFTC